MSVPTSSRTRVARLAERGRYDRETIEAILDQGRVCHVGFVVDGQPYVIPMGYARQGDRLLLHGSVASRMFRHLARGEPLAVAVTHLDGIVLARSQFHHSMNYRSVVVLGRARPIVDDAEKRAALAALVEHMVPGREADARPPTAQELAATEVLAVPLDEASAKVRSGPPGDDPEDLALPIWAGVVPLELVARAPVAAPDLEPGIGRPPYLEAAGEREEGPGAA